MPLAISGQKDANEEARKRIAVDGRGFVDLARNAADEPFKNPYRQRDIEQAMGERDRPDGVEQADRIIEIEERHGEDRRRRHQIGQQPKEQVLVADEGVAIERVSRRQRDGHRNDSVDRDIGERNAEGMNPGRIIENVDVFLERRMMRPQRQPRHDVGIGAQAHVDEPIDRQHQQQRDRRRGRSSGRRPWRIRRPSFARAGS